METMYLVAGAATLGGLLMLFLLVAMAFRVVVSTNDVHIVQSAKRTLSYGKGEANGNTYYKWPAWVPVIGLRVVTLPVSVFDVSLNGYDAYDKGRVPFVVDIMAFFRVTDSNVAAQRLFSFSHLKEQLESILQGSVRTILASYDIESILEGRSEFGDRFTKEVDTQLKEWGVQTVKCIELMDIRDASSSKVIANIMEKKKSHIEMESRVAVAGNKRTAEIAEVDAVQLVEVRKREAEQAVGIRTAEKDQAVGIAKQQSEQKVKEQQKLTAEKTMEVQRVELVRKADIEKEVQVVLAEQHKRTAIVKAEGDKQQVILSAEAQLEAATREAQGTQANGLAKAEAEKALQLASVTAQTELAKEIGSNEGYQTYLVNVRQVEANEKIGVEQAQAMSNADIKIIATGGSQAIELGTVLGAAVEAFTGQAKKILGKQP